MPPVRRLNKNAPPVHLVYRRREIKSRLYRLTVATYFKDSPRVLQKLEIDRQLLTQYAPANEVRLPNDAVAEEMDKKVLGAGADRAMVAMRLSRIFDDASTRNASVMIMGAALVFLGLVAVYAANVSTDPSKAQPYRPSAFMFHP